MTAVAKRIADSKAFHDFIVYAILFAGLLVGIQTYEATSPVVREWMGIIDLLDEIILWIFVAEVVVKTLAEGSRPWRYFFDPWNVFDFTIVAVCFLPFDAEYAAVLRLLRLLRVLKLVRALPRLQVLVATLLKSIPSLMYVSILLLLLFYVYACAGVFIFGGNDPIHFGALPIAMLTLFRVVTGEDWTDVMYIAMNGCDGYSYPEGACTSSEPMPVFGAIYFVTFMLLGAMIFLNLFIGVILSGMEEASEEVAADNEQASALAASSEGEAAVASGAEGRLVELAGQLESIRSELEALTRKPEG